ncbi:hypothetical protein [Allopusillimonas ginsengisoli]|uniref:hypothetical protein n=1 Tax=Allopusillimonas ginsengisoli TaxID=453575 RepID=UPI00102110E8|nr:hypothetical protein [Allopusillimonas ginsengisoli]TEA79490.1 hypothetical protein ERE07_00570 [Allopusillimonas ginsengisoli]
MAFVKTQNSGQAPQIFSSITKKKGASKSGSAVPILPPPTNLPEEEFEDQFQVVVRKKSQTINEQAKKTGALPASDMQNLRSLTLVQAQSEAFKNLRNQGTDVDQIEIYQNDQLVSSCKFDEEAGRWGEWTKHGPHTDYEPDKQHDEKHKILESDLRKENEGRRNIQILKESKPPKTIIQRSIFGREKVLNNPDFEKWRADLNQVRTQIQRANEDAQTQESRIDMDMNPPAHNSKTGAHHTEKKFGNAPLHADRPRMK